MFVAKNPQAGMDWKEYRERAPLIDRIESCEEPGFLLLNDEEWKECKAIWEVSKRQSFNKMIYKVGMALFEAEEIELREIEKTQETA